MVATEEEVSKRPSAKPSFSLLITAVSFRREAFRAVSENEGPICTTFVFATTGVGTKAFAMDEEADILLDIMVAIANDFNLLEEIILLY